MGKVHIVGIKNRLEIEWLNLTKRIHGQVSWEMHFRKYLIQLQCYYIDCEAIGGVFLKGADKKIDILVSGILKVIQKLFKLP